MLNEGMTQLKYIPDLIDVNNSEQKSGAERTKKHKKRELVLFTPPGAQLVLLYFV